MSEKRLLFGLPDGSLVSPNRGNLVGLLNQARIFVENYGGNTAAPPRVTNIPWLEARIGRPQELPSLAYVGEIDIFIAGDDWAEEWAIQGQPTVKMLGLNTGKVTIVAAARRDEAHFEKVTNTKEYLRQKIKGGCRILKVASEYPNIARRFLYEKISDDDLLSKGFKVSKLEDIRVVPFGKHYGIEQGVIVMNSKGATEAKSFYQYADMIIEASQTGTALANFEQEVLEVVLHSEASLYRGTHIESDPWKAKKADRVRTMLKGVVDSAGIDLITFNVHPSRADAILEYLYKNRLFETEPTVIRGKENVVISIQVMIRNTKMPLIDIIGDLKDMGATGIDGAPLSYSISKEPSDV